MRNEKKHTIQLIVAIVAVAFGLSLVGLAFCVPPMGEISPSVLTAYGETLTFAGAIIGVDYRYRDNGGNRNNSRHDND